MSAFERSRGRERTLITGVEPLMAKALDRVKAAEAKYDGDGCRLPKS